MSPRSRLLLAAILLLAASVRIRYFSGLQVGDDVVYSRIAADRAAGDVRFSNVHEARLGFLLPLTTSYALFGPGERPLVLYNFLCSLGLVAALFFLARRFFGDGAGAIAGALAALHPNLVFFATECHTDTPVALWQALAVLAFVSAADDPRPSRKLVLAGLLLGWAWLHKEHAVFLLPFFAGHWIATRRRWTWYLPMALAALGVFVLECLVFAAQSGDPFRRFALVRSMHVGHYMAQRYAGSPELLERLLLELPRRLFWPRAGPAWEWAVNLLGLACGAAALRRKASGARLIAGWWLAVFLSYSFWPSSLRPYLPAFNLYDWTLPPLAGALACFVGAELSRRPRPIAAAALVLVSLGCLLSSELLLERGARFAAGGREAHAWLAREKPGRVLGDEKTLEVLDFLDGHRPARAYVPYQEAKDLAGSIVIVDKFWTEPGRWWSVPGIAPGPSWTKLYESPRLVIYRP